MLSAKGSDRGGYSARLSTKKCAKYLQSSLTTDPDLYGSWSVVPMAHASLDANSAAVE